MRALAPLVAAVAAAGLTGCGGPGPATPPPPVPYDGPVTVVRSGGVAGLRDEVVVRPAEGAWRRTTRRGGATTGALTADERSRVRAALADPALRAEAVRPVRTGGCADGFAFQVTAGPTVVRWVDCGSATDRPEIAANIARLLLSATD